MQRPHPHPFSATTLPLLYPFDYCYPTNCICCLSCSCPCQAPRVYPLPARTSRRLRGGSPVGGHGDVFSGGSPWTVTGPLFRMACFACFHLFTCHAHVRFECFQQASTHENGVDRHAYFSSTFVRLTLGGYNHGVMMRSSLGLT